MIPNKEYQVFREAITLFTPTSDVLQLSHTIVPNNNCYFLFEMFRTYKLQVVLR
jgi:hypothetical protein